jgi:hypothetical protein
LLRFRVTKAIERIVVCGQQAGENTFTLGDSGADVGKTRALLSAVRSGWSMCRVAILALLFFTLSQLRVPVPAGAVFDISSWLVLPYLRP